MRTGDVNSGKQGAKPSNANTHGRQSLRGMRRCTRMPKGSIGPLLHSCAMASASIDPGSAPTRDFGPIRRRIRVRDVWLSRNVAWMLGVRDVKVKYKQAALGPLWLLIAPLGM